MEEKELIIISAVVLIALFGGMFSFGMMGSYGIGNMMHNYYGTNLYQSIFGWIANFLILILIAVLIIWVLKQTKRK